jgi:SAM-dependent methyltransferase
MPSTPTGRRLLVRPGTSASNVARARLDAMALRARGHGVTWARDLDGAPVDGGPPSVVLAYAPAEVFAAVEAGFGPVLHVGAGPATERAAGEPTGAIEAAHAATPFHTAPSPAGQREILLAHGGRCWLLPPGVAPSAITGGATAAPVPHAPLRVVVMDPYDGAPLDWLAHLVSERPAGARYVIDRVAVATPDWARALAGADVALVPSLGPADGSPWLAALIAGQGIPVLLSDAEPHHGLLPPGEDTACFVPPGDVPAILAALELLARDPARLERIRAARATIVRLAPLSRRVDAIEGALRDIAETAPGDGRERLSTIWLPRAHGTITESRYTFAARMVRARRVLDVTCGDGRGGIRLAGAGAERVIGCGAPSRELALARRRLDRGGRVSLLGTHPGELALASRSVDLVVALDGVERLEDPWAFLREAARVLVANGTLLLALDNPRDGADPALRDGVSSLLTYRRELERVFGRVTPFAERIGPWGISFRGETLDADRDSGWILMATRPTRLPTDPELHADVARSPLGRRPAA